MTCRVFGSPEADTEVRFGLWDVVEVSTCGRKVGEGGRRTAQLRMPGEDTDPAKPQPTSRSRSTKH